MKAPMVKLFHARSLAECPTLLGRITLKGTRIKAYYLSGIREISDADKNCWLYPIP
jgi:hypothetical protein